VALTNLQSKRVEKLPLTRSFLATSPTRGEVKQPVLVFYLSPCGRGREERAGEGYKFWVSAELLEERR